MSEAIERALAQINFGPDGLVAAVAQQFDTGEVLMVAWMNREAVRLTLAEGRVCYWSRSRRALVAQGRNLGPDPAPARDAARLRRRHGAAAGRSDRRRLPYRAAQLLLPRLERRLTAGWATIAEPEIPPEQLYPARDQCPVRDRADRPASPAPDSAAPGSWGGRRSGHCIRSYAGYRARPRSGTA